MIAADVVGMAGTHEHRHVRRERPLTRALVVALAVAWPHAPSGASEPERGKVHGIVISTHTDGREWGWDVIGPTIDDIREVGAGWVATHPYAPVRGDGSIPFGAIDPDEPPAYLVRPIREAHERGLKILITPHLAYWGSPFSWRGEIGFTTDAQWERFFEDYRRFIVAVAHATREADGFVVGSELDLTLGHEDAWRRIIAEVRSATPAALTYAANWTDYARVPFWDALDVIGVQAYFPISDAASPGVAALEAGWAARMDELRRFAAGRNRKVVFTELGYNRSFRAAEQPWDDRVDGPEAEALQENLLRVALEAVEAEPAVVGVFLWKWFPQPSSVGRNFQLATPRLKRAIADAWKDGSTP
jgi:hypothetical protein